MATEWNDIVINKVFWVVTSKVSFYQGKYQNRVICRKETILFSDWSHLFGTLVSYESLNIWSIVTFSWNHLIFLAKLCFTIFAPTRRDSRKQFEAPILVSTQQRGKPSGQHPKRAPPRRFWNVKTFIANCFLYKALFSLFRSTLN